MVVVVVVLTAGIKGLGLNNEWLYRRRTVVGELDWFGV